MVRCGEFGYYYALSKWREKLMLKRGKRFFFEKHTYYGNSTVCSADEISMILYQMILDGKPFMAGRFGGTELSALKIFDFEMKTHFRQIRRRSA